MRTWRIAEIAAANRWSLNGGPFGSKLVSSMYVEAGVPVIRGVNLPDNARFSTKGFVYVTPEKADELRQHAAVPGDLVFTQRGTLGQVGHIPKTSLYDRFIISQSQMKLTVDPGKADPTFVYYLFRAPATVQRILDMAISSGVPHINLDALRNFQVELPSLTTQRRIASILSAYDDLIENNERRIAILEDMARRIFREWFVDFRFPGHEAVPTLDTEAGRIPQGWRRVPIKEAYDDLFDGPHATPAPASEGPVFLGIGNITKSGRLDLAEVRHIAEEDFSRWTRRVQPAEGDIVFTYEATLNRYALIPRGFRGCLGRRLALIRANSVTGMNIYLYLLFFTDAWRQLIARNTLSGSTVDRIPLTRFPEFPIILPQQETLAEFDALVCPMLDHMDRLAEANTCLAATRDLLLPRLVSGELSVEAAESVMEAAE